MADFKDHLSPELVARLGTAFSAADGSFDRERFEALACEGLETLEMKARTMHIARALGQTLPKDPHQAAARIRRALAAGGLDGWDSMPVNEYVASDMLDVPELGLALLAELTSRYTAEFAIRPFIIHRYEATMPVLRRWLTSPDEHVRRLVSEGSRPRLPWGQRLTRFIEDPRPGLELITQLVNDESLYVRRSVANHLNDIAKDHPDLVIEAARRWKDISVHGDFVVRHGLRTLVKRGHPEALTILGFHASADVELDALQVTPASISFGEEVTLDFTLRAAEDARAAIDYVVHYQGAKGMKAGKVFKLTTRDLVAGVPMTIMKRHRFAHTSTRTILPGPHLIEVQVNGRVLGGAVVEVTAGEEA